MKEQIAENDKYTVYKTSKKVIVMESKPGQPRMKMKLNLRKEATPHDGEMMLKFFGGMEDEAKKSTE